MDWEDKIYFNEEWNIGEINKYNSDTDGENKWYGVGWWSEYKSDSNINNKLIN